jgi:glutathione S-transferase
VKLYGGPISPFVRKVGICIIDKGLDRQVEPVRAFTAMVQVNRQLMQRNPLSKIPTLETASGTVLYDSDVICEYLDAQSSVAPQLFPPAGDARWQAMCWNALGSGALDALVLWRFERNRLPEQQSPEVLTAFAAKLAVVFNRIEAEMPMIASASYSIAHVSFGCLLGYSDFRFADLDWRAGRPRTCDWYERFTQRPSAQRTRPYDDARFDGKAYPAGFEPFWPPI